MSDDEYEGKVNDDYKNTPTGTEVKDVVFGFSYFLGIRPIGNVSWSQMYC